jgi:hypothetical protein
MIPTWLMTQPSGGGGGGGNTYADYSFAFDAKNGAYRSGTQFASDPQYLTGYSYSRTISKYELSYSGSPLAYAANVPGIVPNVGYWARSATTNLLLGAGSATVLATQGVAVTAQDYTLSFIGTGTITLSGVSTAGPLVGTGAANRVSLTFTPTAGTLTVTVSGSVTYAGLVAGTLAGPIITTTGSAVTVGADDMRFSQPIPADEDWVVYATAVLPATAANQVIIAISNGSTNERIAIYSVGASLVAAVTAGGVVLFTGTATGAVFTGPGRVVIGLRRRAGKYTTFAMNQAGQMGLSVESAVLGFPTGMNRIDIGDQLGGALANGAIEFVGLKRGTFTDADVNTMMLNAVPSPKTILGPDLLEAWESIRYDLITQSAGVVSAWAGSVNGYTVTQAVGGQKPAYSATGFNGKPVLTFDSVDDYMELAPNPFSTTDPVEVWVVADQQAPFTDTLGRRAVAMGNGGATDRAILSLGDNVSASIALAGANNLSATRSGFSGRHVFRAIIEVDGLTAILDGGTPSAKTLTTTVSNSARIRIGASGAASPGGYWKGGINSVLVTRPLSSAKAAALLAYYNEGGL